MSDDEETKPSQPSLATTPDAANAILAALTAGFARQDARSDRLESVVNTLVEDGKVSNLRMTRIEVRMDGVESRTSTNSMRVKAESSSNLQQDAAIGALIVKVDAVDAKVDAVATENVAQTAMLTTLTAGAKKLAANPTVHTIAILLGAALIAWLKGHLQ